MFSNSYPPAIQNISKYNKLYLPLDSFIVLPSSSFSLSHIRACACCAFCSAHVQVTVTVPVTKHLHLMPGSTPWPFVNSSDLTEPGNVQSRVLTLTGRKMHVLLQEVTSVNSLAVLFDRDYCHIFYFIQVCVLKAWILGMLMWLVIDLNSSHGDLQLCLCTRSNRAKLTQSSFQTLIQSKITLTSGLQWNLLSAFMPSRGWILSFPVPLIPHRDHNNIVNNSCSNNKYKILTFT